MLGLRHFMWSRVGLLIVLALGFTTLSGCDFLSDITSPTFSEVEEDLAESGDLIVGGDFTAINGVARTAIARIGRDGVVDERFVVEIDGAVLVVTPVVIDGEPVLFVGGEFSVVNGEPRTSIAALDPRTGELLPNFAPILGATSSGRPGVQAILPVPERRTIIVGGSFSGAATDTATGTMDSGLRTVAELDWSDGSAVDTFRPGFLATSAGEPAVYTLAPGLGEIGAWSVVVGGRFGVETGSTDGLVLYALTVLDETGSVRALAEPATADFSAVYSLRTDARAQFYRFAGMIFNQSSEAFSPEDELFYGGIYYIDGAVDGGINYFTPDESEPLVDGSRLAALVFDGVPTVDENVLVAGLEGFWTPPDGLGYLPVAVLLDRNGDGFPNSYLRTGGGYPNALVYRIRPVRGSYYLVGRFDQLIDTLGVASGPTVARVDQELRVDPFFSIIPTGTQIEDLPSMYELVELPIGF